MRGKTILVKLARLVGGIRLTLRLLISPGQTRSYYPDEPRKSRGRIAMELIYWHLRYGEPFRFYFSSGMDRRGASLRSAIPYRRLTRERDRRNLHPKRDVGFDYLCLVRDKFVFGQLAAQCHVLTPKNIALYSHGMLTWLDSGQSESLETALSGNDDRLEVFCKSVTGVAGRQVFQVSVKDGSIFVNGDEVTLPNLRAMLPPLTLFQARVEQHEAMSRLYPASLNTIRFITIHDGGQVRTFFVALRVGAGGNRVDNWAAGGLIVRVDPKSGCAIGSGLHKPGYGTRVEAHPDTGVVFDGFEIPHFHDAEALAHRLHRHLFGLHSIGWDIGITNDGPTVIEGNDNWDGGIPISLEPRFREQFLEAFQ